jgi:mono/diheme cytochrome c family protein
LLVGGLSIVGCDKKEASEAPPPENVDGRELYMRKCAHCHGNQGRGDGPASQTYARVADFSDPSLHERLADEQIRSIITNGIGQMPPVRGLHPVEVEAVTEFVRTLNASHEQ